MRGKRKRSAAVQQAIEKRIHAVAGSADGLEFSDALKICLAPSTSASTRLDVLEETGFVHMSRLRKEVKSIKAEYASIIAKTVALGSVRKNRLLVYAELAIQQGLRPATVETMRLQVVRGKLLKAETKHPRIATVLVCGILILSGRSHDAETLPYTLPSSHTTKTIQECLEWSSPFVKTVFDYCDSHVAQTVHHTSYPEKHRRGILKTLSYLLQYIKTEGGGGGADPIRAWLERADLAEVRRLLVSYAESREVRNEYVKTSTRRHSARNLMVFTSNMFKKALLHFMPNFKHHELLTCKDLLSRAQNRRIAAPADLRRTFTREETERMIEATRDPRWAMLLTLLSTIALRNSAVGRLTYGMLVDDQHVPRDICNVPEKGRQVRQFKTPAVLKRSIKAFIDWYRPQIPDAVDVFETFVGNAEDPHKPMGDRTLQRWVKRFAKRSEVTDVAVHPHAFRATLVGSLMESGMPLNDVSAFMGHRSTSTTMRDYWLTDVVDLVAKMNNPFGLEGECEPEGSVEHDEDIQLCQIKLRKIGEIIKTYEKHLEVGVGNGCSAADVQRKIASANPDLTKLIELLGESEDESDEGDGSGDEEQ
jgi:integrase